MVYNIVNPCGEQKFTEFALAQTEAHILRPFFADYLHVNLRCNFGCLLNSDFDFSVVPEKAGKIFDTQ